MRPLVPILLLGAASLAQAERRIALDVDLRVDAKANAAVEVADAFADALAAGDLDTVKSLLSDDVIVLESGGVETSRDEYFAHHAAADAKYLADATQTITRRIAKAEGGAVWIATESTLAKPNQSPAKSTETLVLAKRKGDWKIVHIHWSSRD
jgi:uncharacterized protein (TIGR02246 family)